MDLQERINVLTQGAELAQKAGALTLDEAYLAKQAIDALKNNTLYKVAFDILIRTAQGAQKKGVYTLRDAHILYLASENYESVIPQPQPQPQQQVKAEPDTTTASPVEKKPRGTKKES